MKILENVDRLIRRIILLFNIDFFVEFQKKLKKTRFNKLMKWLKSTSILNYLIKK